MQEVSRCIEPIQLKDSFILNLVQILREYKSMKNCTKGHWQLEGILNAGNDTIEDLQRKVGLCFGEYAPFKMFVHPSKSYSEENVLKYVKAYQEEPEVLWTE